MIRHLQCFITICHLFVFIKSEPIIGHNISPANPLEFPFIASLGYKNLNGLAPRGHFCTGSLISTKRVITAAHCLVNLTASQVDVIIGEVDLTIVNNESIYDVGSWITYVDWALKRGKALEYETNDVAIVKLSRAVNQNGVIPVRLSNLNIQQVPRTNGIIAGWGVTNQGTVSDLLLKAKVMILPHDKCEEKFKLLTNLAKSFHKNGLCSSAVPYTLTACGDSGGPLLNENKVLLGIGRASCPKDNWGDFPPEFVNQYKFNVAMSIDFCRDFIEDVAKIKTRSFQIDK